MKLDKTMLIEIQDYINILDGQVGLKPETISDIQRSIHKMKKSLVSVEVSNKKIPSPPKPPLDRILREGAIHTCNICGSTASKNGFGIFGEMLCHNKKCVNSNSGYI